MLVKRFTEGAPLKVVCIPKATAINAVELNVFILEK